MEVQMNNKKISNPKTNVPKGKSLNDKDYMNSLLSSLKEMVKNYAVVLTEASNETLYKQYKRCLMNMLIYKEKYLRLCLKRDGTH